MNEKEIRKLAFRDFVAGLAGISALVVVVALALGWNPSSPFAQEPYRTVVLGFLLSVWLGAALSLTRSLRRDLTKVELTETGLKAGRKVIPYRSVSSVDSQLGRRVFRVKLLSGRSIFLSKIGTDGEQVFFAELQTRLSGNEA